MKSNNKNMTAMLNNFEVKRGCDFVRLSNWVNFKWLSDNKLSGTLLYRLVEELKQDKHLRLFKHIEPETARLQELWNVTPPDQRSSIAWSCDVAEGEERLQDFWGQEVVQNETVEEIKNLQHSLITSVEARFKICGVSHQVPLWLHILPNKLPYKATIDIQGFIMKNPELWDSPNCLGDYTISTSDLGLLPKLIELLMIVPRNINYLYVYNSYTGNGYTYVLDWNSWEPMSLKRRCEDYFHKMLELRDKQELDNKCVL